MKKIFILLIVSASVCACGSTDKKVKSEPFAPPTENATSTTDLTTIEWLDSTSIDLGSIKEGQIVEVQYHFKNTGDKNLVIENVAASCGCTVAEKPEKPIAPGQEDVIKAKFDSRGKMGQQVKNITVTANTTPEKFQNLTFKVQVTE